MATIKTMTIEQKAKAYDEAIAIAMEINNEQRAQPFDVMTRVFPELKESEDEKIIKEIISYIKSSGAISNKKWIAWLEKQGDDKVEQKFKIGDWVVFNNKHQSIYQVEKIEDGYYILRHTHGGTFRVCVLHDESLRPWTIQDAKDGDVLAFYSEYRGNKMVQVGIIEKYVGKHGGCSNTFKIYVGVNWDNILQIGEYMGCSDIRPATKEQRDQLKKAMADAGYIFDFEKKELKKIEQAPAWSEEDERNIKELLYLVEANHLSSEEPHDRLIKFLKSLKDRHTWKPSEEQIIELRHVISGCSYDIEPLVEIEEQLKKLREE